MTEILSIMICVMMINVINSQTADTFLQYGTGLSTAMDVEYTSNLAAFATLGYQIFFYNSGVTGLMYSINTGHKANITTLSISPDASLILTGSKDFTARVYSIPSGSQQCAFLELRGEVISSKIGSDNDFYAFGTMEGYLYYGSITTCSITKLVLGNQFKSVEIIVERNQIWIADNTFDIIVVDTTTNSVSQTYTMQTNRTASVYHLSQAYLMAICTEQAFYMLDYSGNVVFQIIAPIVYMSKCRIVPGWSGVTGEYYLTAISEQLQFVVSGVTFTPVWNIWQIQTQPLSASLFHQQYNSGNRFGVLSTRLKDAATFYIDGQNIKVNTISDNNNSYYNYYQGLGTGACPGGYIPNSVTLACQKCNFHNGTRSNCSTCNQGNGQCASCLHFSYLAPNNTCVPCALLCTGCTSTSNTSCTGCVGGYTLVSGSCKPNNISGCMMSTWVNPVSYCSDCILNFFSENNVTCKSCPNLYPACAECDFYYFCWRCQPHFLIVKSGYTGSCEACTMSIEGCAECINQTYCDTCFDEYPYFDYPSVGSRTCKANCYITCLTCLHLEYLTCTSCDSNRTLNSSAICVCSPEYPIYNTVTNQCLACTDYIPNCLDCTNSTYCISCPVDLYFDDLVPNTKYCKACNYTCLTCNTTWYSCVDCDPMMYRVLSSNGSCVCQSISYFEVAAPQVACELCDNWIANCDVCFNKTYCVACTSGYFIKTVSSGINSCSPCQLPCFQCMGTATNCTDCDSGRTLNLTTNTCNCLLGYFPDTATSCAPCSPLLGSCLKCTNNSACQQCWTNAYFVMVGTIQMCDLCLSPCLTCNTWNNVCATCDPLANRVLNAVTKHCDCMVGYTETSGRCLNCTSTFQYCTSCDGVLCYACAPGYSLAYGGLKCILCQTTYPGCTLCLNGVCAACNTSLGYQLAYSKCICALGYYEKDYDCLPYDMGLYIKRSFMGYGTFSQSMDTSIITIEIYFRCQGLKLPYGIKNSVNISINGVVLTSYNVTQINTTFIFTFPPPSDVSMADIQVQFYNNTIYDLDEYQPYNRLFKFTKNIFYSTQYQLASSFINIYQNFIITIVRWLVTIFALIGCADLILPLVFTTHLIPAFLLLGLSTPMPLQYVLETMITINFKNLFVFTQVNLKLQGYGEYVTYATYTELLGSQGGVIYNKIGDLIFMGCLLVFYGILCPMLKPYIPEGQMQKFWDMKFIKKRYSTISSTILCFLPTFLTCAIFDIRIQKFYPDLYGTIAASIVILAFSGCFVFVHVGALMITQFSDQYKNQDCYFGSSTLEQKSTFYILSFLVVTIWTIPFLGVVNGVECIPFIVLMIIWEISHFRFWVNFPNKFLYFVNIFQAVCLVLYTLAFLTFTIAESYSAVPINTLELIGLSAMVDIIIIFSFSSLKCILLILYSLYKSCHTSSNLVQNIEQSKQKQGTQQGTNEQTSVMNMRASTKIKANENFDAKLTNKQQHMMRFREQHLRETMNSLYPRGMSDQIGTSSQLTNSGFRK